MGSRSTSWCDCCGHEADVLTKVVMQRESASRSTDMRNPPTELCDVCFERFESLRMDFTKMRDR